jgi:hypothetical protein
MELDYKKINNNYIHSVDKFYRMFSGLSSYLLSYENETIELEIEVSSRWEKDPRTTSIQLSSSWRRSCHELSDAKKYKVHLSYLAPNCEKGAAIQILDDESEMAALIENLVKTLNQEAKPIYTVILEGLIDDDQAIDTQAHFMN